MADLHLGKRGAGRTVNGRNQRELDIEAAWFRAVDIAIEAQPDLITIAGDVFDSVRPNFHAVLAWQRGIRRIAEETSAYVVVIQGNHEGPRTNETACPNLVVEGLDAVSVVTAPTVLLHHTAGWINDPAQLVAITCLPFVGLGAEQVFTVEPHPGADVNVLLIHAAVKSSAIPGALPTMYGGAAAYDVARAEGFDVVACGDFHEFSILNLGGWASLGEDYAIVDEPPAAGPLAFYSGSIERTSSNIWQETAPKGVVLYDTAERTLEFREIETRPVANATGAFTTTEALNGFLDSLLRNGIRDGLVRVVIDGFPRGERDSVDWKTVAALKEANVHFLLDLRMAERDVRDLGDRRERGARTLADEAAAFFEEDEEAVRETAMEYLGFGLVPVPA